MRMAMSSLALAAAAAQLVSHTMNTLNAVRERAKSSKDADLKAHISSLYDDVLSLKEVIARFTDEANNQQRRIAELEHPEEKRPEPDLRQVGAVNYYFLGEKGPYCQRCYDGQKKLVALTPPEKWNDGLRRHCVMCNKFYYEIPMDLSPAFGVVSGPKLF